jgi:hypothetical protein
VALKLPHVEAGVQDHVTPRFWLSFVTVAAICAVALVASEVGGAYCCPVPGNATVIVGGGVVVELLLPPHPTNASMSDAARIERVKLERVKIERVKLETVEIETAERRNVIARLR